MISIQFKLFFSVFLCLALFSMPSKAVAQQYNVTIFNPDNSDEVFSQRCDFLVDRCWLDLIANGHDIKTIITHHENSLIFSFEMENELLDVRPFENGQFKEYALEVTQEDNNGTISLHKVHPLDREERKQSPAITAVQRTAGAIAELEILVQFE